MGVARGVVSVDLKDEAPPLDDVDREGLSLKERPRETGRGAWRMALWTLTLSLNPSAASTCHSWICGDGVQQAEAEAMSVLIIPHLS
jgi:hypothetical protein